METIAQDIEFGLRRLRSAPGFSLVATSLLTFGIGANIALFAATDALLLRARPGVRDADRLVWISPQTRGRGRLSYRDLERFQNETRVFESIAGFHDQQVVIAQNNGTSPERVRAEAVTGEYFAVLRTPMELGRALGPADDARDAPIAVVLSHSLWTRRFAAERSVIGREVMLNGRRATIVGVAPPHFNGADVDEPRQLWTTVTGLDDRPSFDDCEIARLVTIARLRNKSSSAIGHETVDPLGVGPSGGCLIGYTFRWSDAAVIQYNSGTIGKWSYVARTSSGTTFSDFEPIVAQQDTAIQGEFVARMGATSGYARGQVINTNTGVTETDAAGNPLHVIIHGSVEVDVGAQLGDSGGPVNIDPPIYNMPGQATITGIEFGSNYPTSTVFFYSPLDLIFVDLGFMTVYGTTVNITGTNLITTPANYVWTANALGSSGYHYQWQQSTNGGSTWTNIGTDSPTYNQDWTIISPGFRYQFILRGPLPVLTVGTVKQIQANNLWSM